MCYCVNIEIGTYQNQIELVAPSWSSKNTICVDACLKDEIIFLWKEGVETNGCCCGHNKLNGYIGVYPEFHNKMVGLGYKYYTNEFNVVCYTPKTKYQDNFN